MAGILEQYQKLTRLPGGSFLFNKGIGLNAPFFGKIRPNVVEYRRAYCKVQIKDRWSVRNHIGTINAGALCSLAELTGGMALDSVVPKTMRWIPSGMTVAYLAKATGTITAICELDADSVKPGELSVSIVVRNQQGDKVFTADITFYISNKS